MENQSNERARCETPRRAGARACLLAGSALLLVAGSVVHAQSNWPVKPVRMILGFSAGGISDVLGRAVAAKMTANMGQSIVVENKPGAGSTIACDYVAKSPPDGYTIMLQDIASHAINASLYSKLPYHSTRDFAPVTLLAASPLMLVVHPTSSARTVQELVALLKAGSGKLTYGSSGAGTVPHLAAEQLKALAGADIVHVPYKGSTPSTQAILANEVSFVFSSMPPAVSNVKAGKLRALAVTSAKRVSAVGDVPTMLEAGLRDAEFVVYSGILAPAGTPRPIIDRLRDEFARAMASDEMKAVADRIGAEPAVGTPEALGALVEREIARYAPLVRASGVKVD